ncbi:gas vesicle protein GvpO, partial [Streptomyces sp. NPDC086077]|uniref:gas vesicle protein GvpO n=1 Tax=Streptomyces sp. NPDC086077 TaxID=3154862 RepID=UPI0034341D54
MCSSVSASCWTPSSSVRSWSRPLPWTWAGGSGGRASCSAVWPTTLRAAPRRPRRTGHTNRPVEVVELERIPETTSVMASYEVAMDPAGQLLA